MRGEYSIQRHPSRWSAVKSLSMSDRPHRRNPLSVAILVPARSLFWALLLLGLLSQAGCVALNIPSERVHDDADGGGVLGHWRGTLVTKDTISGEFHEPGRIDSSASGPIACDRCLGDTTAEECSSGGCFSDCDGEFDSLCEEDEGKPKPPEIPWPRFHPIPTRPVFGGRGLPIGDRQWVSP